MDDREREIRLKAHDLCKKYVINRPQEIYDRNEKIIQFLMKEFNLSHKEAKYQFEHNNDSQ